MGSPVYTVDEFPDEGLPWLIEWIGGLGYNTSVPSEPRIDVCLAQLPLGETNPLSARSRSSQTKRTVKIGVGLLPYISIASVWQKRWPVVTDLAAYRHRLRIDTTSCRIVVLGELTSSLAPIRALLPEGDRKALGALAVFYLVVDNDKPPFPPADCTSWNEPERDGHATFPVSSWRAKCTPTITNSLSFADSEFTFSNNLRLLEAGQVIELKHNKQRLCIHSVHLPQQPAQVRHSQTS
jgi:hypothetical protein